MKVKLEHPQASVEKNEQQKVKYQLVKYSQQHFYFKVTGISETTIIQQYQIDQDVKEDQLKENNFIFLKQQILEKTQFLKVRQLRTLPYYQTSCKCFISLNRTFDIIDLSSLASLEGLHNKEKIQSIGDIYSRDFRTQLFTDCTKSEILGIKDLFYQEVCQIPQLDMIIFFIKNNEAFYGSLIIQPQKKKMKLIK